MKNNKKSFYQDEEKMRDFMILSKENFLEAYSYITEEEYEETKRQMIIEITTKSLVEEHEILKNSNLIRKMRIEQLEKLWKTLTIMLLILLTLLIIK